MYRMDKTWAAVCTTVCNIINDLRSRVELLLLAVLLVLHQTSNTCTCMQTCIPLHPPRPPKIYELQALDKEEAELEVNLRRDWMDDDLRSVPRVRINY